MKHRPYTKQGSLGTKNTYRRFNEFSPGDPPERVLPCGCHLVVSGIAERRVRQAFADARTFYEPEWVVLRRGGCKIWPHDVALGKPAKVT